MSLISSNTKWVLFLSTSQVDPDSRHVLDLVYGLACLEKAGVQPSNICIYVDGKYRNNIKSLFQIGSSNTYQIKMTNEFFTEMGENSHENLVMFITGHGSERGIDATPPITPHRLLDSIKSAPGLDKAVVYLGQCFAGIFNYVKASRNVKRRSRRERVLSYFKPSQNSPIRYTSPEIILIGATELQESLSSSTSETLPTTNVTISWVANLFLLHVFKWLSSPIDVDGDSLNTIIDSYKYAGVMANRSCKEIKASAFIQLMDAYDDFKIAQKKAATSTGDPLQDMTNKLVLKAMNDRYLQNSNLNNVHQECWVLNAIPAQILEI